MNVGKILSYVVGGMVVALTVKMINRCVVGMKTMPTEAEIDQVINLTIEALNAAEEKRIKEGKIARPLSSMGVGVFMVTSRKPVTVEHRFMSPLGGDPYTAARYKREDNCIEVFQGFPSSGKELLLATQKLTGGEVGA